MLEIPTRSEVMAKVRDEGGRIAAVFPIFYPRELLRACGFWPMELWNPRNCSGSAPERLQPYTCSIARLGMAFLQNGGFDQVDAVLVPHTCDTLQGVGSILRDYVKPTVPVLTLYHPRGGHGYDADFLVAELQKLATGLTGISGCKPTAADLLTALRREEEADAALARLYQDRRLLPLTDSEFYRLVRCREYVPAEPFRDLADAVPRSGSPATITLKPIAISGIVIDPPELLDEINAMGATVVCDDLACGSRRLNAGGTSPDPWRRMAERLLATAPEPTRGQSMSARIDYLKNLLGTHGARGLLVYDPKFCEPELFDLPHLRQALQAQGLPLLHIESEGGELPDGQVRTRLEAFIEMLP